ncbi:MAG: hypothetical protein ACK5KR_09060 [Breznakia sp.]
MKIKKGDWIIYKNGNYYEIGLVKRIKEDKAFAWYHLGGTASCTPFYTIIYHSAFLDLVMRHLYELGVTRIQNVHALPSLIVRSSGIDTADLIDIG